MLRFIHHLGGKAKPRFEEDWNIYQQWYQDICCRGIGERIWPPEGENEYRKIKSIDPVDLINKLISHTAPK
jgi:hypothetical protein